MYMKMENEYTSESNNLEDINEVPQDDTIELGNIGIEWYDKVEDDLEGLGWPIDRINNILKDTKEYYFQKRKDTRDKRTDNPIKCYRITVALEENVYLQIDCKQNFDSYYCQFWVSQFAIVPFLPEQNFKKALCSRVGKWAESSSLRKFLEDVDTLLIENGGSRQERDSKIWYTYTRALKQLIWKKDRFFCLAEISMPEAGRGKDGEHVAKLCIRINEKHPKMNYGLVSEDFLYYTPEQYKQIQALRKEARNGEYIDGEKEVQACKLGKLLEQRGMYELVFEVEDAFMELMKHHESKEKQMKLMKGYIAPTFALEYANIRRMETAMEKIVHPGQKYGYPANVHLSKFIFDSSLVEESQEEYAAIQEKIIQNCQEKRLNDRQLEAVTKAILAPDLAIIQGPPGTGKTTVISEIIRQTIRRNPDAKILLSSQTHVAVDNAIGRLAACEDIFPLRIGKTERMEPEGLYCSDEVILAWMNGKRAATRWQENIHENIIFQRMEKIRKGCSHQKQDSEAISIWQEWLSSNEAKQTIYDIYLKQVNLFAATCSECGSKRFMDRYQSLFEGKGKTFDLVIIDETSKAMPPELAIPLTIGKKIVLIGDHKQLPPMLDEQEFGEAMRCMGEEKFYEELSKDEYQTCLFEKLFLSAPESIRASLDTQYRMHSQIMRCIQQFYMDQEELSEGLKAGLDDREREHGLRIYPFLQPEDHAIWINTEGEEKKVGPSRINDLEIRVVEKVLELLDRADGIREFAQKIPAREKEIGIISYYKAQVERLQKRVQDKEVHGLQVSAKTVDRFQGMEREIIIMSTVRSHIKQDGENKSIGFAKDTKRINVGMSRAKRLLIVVGDRSLFEGFTEYRKVIRQMKKIDWKSIEKL